MLGYPHRITLGKWSTSPHQYPETFSSWLWELNAFRQPDSYGAGGDVSNSSLLCVAPPSYGVRWWGSSLVINCDVGVHCKVEVSKSRFDNNGYKGDSPEWSCNYAMGLDHTLHEEGSLSRVVDSAFTRQHAPGAVGMVALYMWQAMRLSVCPLLVFKQPRWRKRRRHSCPCKSERADALHRRVHLSPQFCCSISQHSINAYLGLHWWQWVWY